MSKIIPPRIDLHAHLGSSVDPPILWSLAHMQGIKLPSKDYWDFENMITMRGDQRNKDLDEMHNKFFYWTELIQSSPFAVEESVKSIIGGGYRKCNLVVQELRFNPMFRNRGGEQDLDHIIMAALRGMDKAMLEYPQVKAGIILMMDRTLSFRENEIIIEKALKYFHKGVIGVDLGGPQRESFMIQDYKKLFQRAKRAGLGVTIHTGEEGAIDELAYVVYDIKPHRIGHGLLCIHDEKIMRKMVKNNIVLETCPTSNLRNSKVKNIDELKTIIHTYLDKGVRFTINTDGPEMYQTNVYKEEKLLLDNNIVTSAVLRMCRRYAFMARFVA
ncbi:MAG: adenosine deaminase [bacterium]